MTWKEFISKMYGQTFRHFRHKLRRRLGYPTPKTRRASGEDYQFLHERRNWVLDPFCGCGTAIVASEKLNRHWVGIDITFLAINVVKNRLKGAFPNSKYKVEGEPKDLTGAKQLAQNRYQFQYWALSLVGARPYGSKTAYTPLPKIPEGKKGVDHGIDGIMRFKDGPEGHIERIIVQVKSGHVSVKDIRELRDVVSSQKAAMGVFLTLEEPTSEMMNEVKATEPYVSPRWNKEYPKIQILTIEQLLKGERPNSFHPP